MQMSRNRWVLAIGAIAAAVILVLAGVIEFYQSVPVSEHAVKPVGTFGPRVQVSGVATTGALANNTTTQIQMFSAVPSAFRNSGILYYPISASAQSNNGADDELLDVTLLPGNTTSTFFLAPLFDTIAQQWAALLSHDQGMNYPSMTLEAVRTVSSGSAVSVYQYYNNVLYNPSDLQTLSLNSSELLSPGATAWFQGSGVNTSQYSEVQLANLEFNLSLQFSAQPIEVFSAGAAAAHGGVSTGQSTNSDSIRTCSLSTDSCTYNYQYVYYNATANTLLKTTFINSTLPLIGVQIGTGANNGKSIVSLGASVSVLNDTIDLNSAQPYENAQSQISTAMSTSPSFAHVANVTVGSSGNSYSAIPLSISELSNNFSVSQNQTTAVVGIQGVEYEFQHFNQSTNEHKQYWKTSLCCTGTTCHSSRTLLSDVVIKSTYDGTFTAGGIIHINSTAGLQVQASYESIWVAWTMDHFVARSSNGTVNLATSGSDDSYEASTIWASTYGYDNAANAYNQAVGSLGSFTSALSLGLDIAVSLAAANFVDFDASEVAVIAEAASLILDVIGMAASVEADFSSISVFTGTNALSFIYSFTNQPFTEPGSPYTVEYFESSSQTSFTVNSNYYSFYSPENWMNVSAIS